MIKQIRLILFAAAAMLPLQAFAESPSMLEEKMAKEERWKGEGLFLLPHRPNYFMPVSYNPHPNNAVYPMGSAPLKDIETKFQLSVKVPVADHLFNTDMQAVLAYTQVSYWQAYNKQKSALFRDTDYEPEFFLQRKASTKIGPLTSRINRLGYDHQSNGLSDPLSRSWNRLYMEFVLDTANTMISIKPWFRIAGPAEEDSNPDMWKYYGYGELRAAVKFWKSNEASLMFRNNLRIPDNKGAIELGWAFPLLRSMKGFIQYFNGYGESLIDYNTPVSRISAGVSFSDWL
jgi:phospholipase A1